MAAAASARSLNIELQRALNPPGELCVERFGWTVGHADKVMQVANAYDREVHNGDLGIVSGLGMEEGEITAICDGRDVTYGLGELHHASGLTPNTTDRTRATK